MPLWLKWENRLRSLVGEQFDLKQQGKTAGIPKMRRVGYSGEGGLLQRFQ